MSISTGPGLSRVAVALPSRVEPVADVLVRSGATAMERRMFAKIHGLRDTHVLSGAEHMEDLLVAAGRAALSGGPAGLVLYGHSLLTAELDLGGAFRDRLLDRLGLAGAGFFGISYVNCTSVLRAVELARRYLHRPGAAADDRVLVLGGEQGSASDRGRYIENTTVAGDAVAAVVLHRAAVTAGVRYRYLGGAARRDLRFHQNLRLTPKEFALFGRACAAEAVEVVRLGARSAGLTADQLDWIMPHLSNRMFWRAFASESGIPSARICLDLMAERGHNYGTDALMSLEHADQAGRLRPGDRCALVSIGQGAYFQSVIIEVVEGT